MRLQNTRDTGSVYSLAIARRREKRDREVSRFCVCCTMVCFLHSAYVLRSNCFFFVVFVFFGVFRRLVRLCVAVAAVVVAVVVSVVVGFNRWLMFFFHRIVLPSCICGYFSLLIILHPPDRQSEYTKVYVYMCT